MRKHAPLAAVVALCFVAVVALWANRTYGPEPRPRPDVLTVHELSIALSRYAGEYGQPQQMSNREVADLLLAAGFVQEKHVTDGEIRDWWGTPYAVFFASEPDQFSDVAIEIGGQSVRPVQGAGRYLMHQVISAGPDRTFGTDDDFGSWEDSSD